MVADSAFAFSTWLIKPYTCAIPEERCFNYHLSCARMVTECAYGQLKGRFRVLHRNSECNEDTMKAITLACIVLHNICIECDEAIPMQLYLSNNISGWRDRETVR